MFIIVSASAENFRHVVSSRISVLRTRLDYSSFDYHIVQSFVEFLFWVANLGNGLNSAIFELSGSFDLVLVLLITEWGIFPLSAVHDVFLVGELSVEDLGVLEVVGLLGSCLLHFILAVSGRRSLLLGRCFDYVFCFR